MCFVFPNKKSLHGIILLLIRVNNGGFTVMLAPAHFCFPFNFHTQRLHLCVLRYIQNDLSRYKIPAGEGIALIDRIVSNRNVWHLVCWCQSASDVWTQWNDRYYNESYVPPTAGSLTLHISLNVSGNRILDANVGRGLYFTCYIWTWTWTWWKKDQSDKSQISRLCRGSNLGKATQFCCIKASSARSVAITICHKKTKQNSFWIELSTRWQHARCEQNLNQSNNIIIYN